MAPNGYRFGIELEVILSPRGTPKKKYLGLQDAANEIIAFSKANSSNSVEIQLATKCSTSLTGWSITGDLSIRPDNPDKQCKYPIMLPRYYRPPAHTTTSTIVGLELVSPILHYRKGSSWRAEVRKLYVTVSHKFVVDCNFSCGLHIHTSPPEGVEWNIKTLKPLCKSIFHFDGAIQVLVPETRRGNQWTASNRDSPKLEGKKDKDIFRLTDECQTKEQVTDLMNGNSRNFAWNFRNLGLSKKSTVEFRLAPGADEVSKCLLWVEFVVSFVHAANMSKLQGFSQDIEGQRSYITANEVPGLDIGILKSLFHGKTGSIYPIRVPPLSEYEKKLLAEKEKEHLEKNFIIKKMDHLP